MVKVYTNVTVSIVILLQFLDGGALWVNEGRIDDATFGFHYTELLH
jgi:hypothetical protein